MENKTESIGRNEPCPCGSHKKYKRCCGVAASPLVRQPKTQNFSPPPGFTGALPGGLSPGLPKGMSLKLMMKLTKILKKLPPEQIQKLQSIMSSGMAGHDVRTEMEAFSKTLPKEFQDLIQSMQKEESDFSSEPSQESKFSKIWKSVTGKKSLQDRKLRQS